MSPFFRNPGAVLLGVIVLGSSLAAAPVSALDFGFSTTTNETFQGVALDNEDFGIFDTLAGPGSEVRVPFARPNPTLFTSPENLDAYAFLNGVHYFSLTNGATLDDGSGAFTVDDDDIIAWNRQLGQASVFHDVGVGDVDAISFHSDGDLLISFTTGTTFHGLSLQDGDVAKFDPGAATITPVEFFDENVFAPQWDLDGYHYVSDTEQYFSTVAGETLAGVAVADGDIVLWDGTTVSVVLTEASFGSSTGGFDVDALGIPEPEGSLLLGMVAAGLGLAGARRRS